MRAPDSAAAAMARSEKQRRRHVGLSGQFSREQCEKIERSLTDADAAAWVVREEIQMHAHIYGLMSRLKYRPPERELNATLDVLEQYATRYVAGLIDLNKDERRRAVNGLYAAIEQMALDSRHVYTKYWMELARLWQRIVPNAASRRDKHAHLRNFLRACTEPVFPTVLRDPKTGKPTDGALIAFTDRYFRRTAS
jgi:hypothetical protein